MQKTTNLKMKNTYHLFFLLFLFSLFQQETLALPPMVHRCRILDTPILVAKTPDNHETPNKNPKAIRAAGEENENEYKDFNIF